MEHKSLLPNYQLNMCFTVAFRLLILFKFMFVTGNLFNSGLYLVNTTKKSNDFSAAWLMSRHRFVDTESNIKNATGMASATFSALRYKCKNCRSVVTRDFFDFMVEHLSSSTNQIPHYNQNIMNISNHRIQKYTQVLKFLVTTPVVESRLRQTIGLLIFSSNCFSKSDIKIQRITRPVFFEVTFWSLYRYVKDITVFVATQKDADTVNLMGLPYFQLTILDVPTDSKNRTVLLPKASLLNVLNSLKYDQPSFRQFRYVYYSEGDQILHWRDPQVMFDVIDNSNGTFAVVPHRLQTLTLKQDFPSELHSLWGASHAQDVPGVQLVVEDVHLARGSCCNSGDVDVARCPGWWYQCTDYGLKNFTTWIKFGEHGFTMPPVTEHKATCEYHPERHLCEVPVECVNRIPVVPSGANRPLKPRDVCGEVQRSVHLGPSDEVAEMIEQARVAARRKREKAKADRDAAKKKKEADKGVTELVVDSQVELTPMEQQKAELVQVYAHGVKKSRSRRSRQGSGSRKSTGEGRRAKSGEGLEHL